MHPGLQIEVKTAIKRNARVHRKWVLRRRVPEERGNIRSVQNETNRIIRNAKKNYLLNLGETLSTYGTGSKSFWTLCSVNKKQLPTYQCSLNHTSGTLPPLRSNHTSGTASSPSYENGFQTFIYFNTTEDKISSIIQSLNTKKAHGYDGIPINLLKLCAPVVAKPLNQIFTKCSLEGKFPDF